METETKTPVLTDRATKIRAFVELSALETLLIGGGSLEWDQLGIFNTPGLDETLEPMTSYGVVPSSLREELWPLAAIDDDTSEEFERALLASNLLAAELWAHVAQVGARLSAEYVREAREDLDTDDGEGGAA